MDAQPGFPSLRTRTSNSFCFALYAARFRSTQFHRIWVALYSCLDLPVFTSSALLLPLLPSYQRFHDRVLVCAIVLVPMMFPMLYMLVYLLPLWWQLIFRLLRETSSSEAPSLHEFLRRRILQGASKLMYPMYVLALLRVMVWSFSKQRWNYSRNLLRALSAELSHGGYRFGAPRDFVLAPAPNNLFIIHEFIYRAIMTSFLTTYT